MPIKRFKDYSKDKVKILIKETCVAEMTHFIVCLCGFYCTEIWECIGGIVLSLIYTLLNVPFIIIQRYNRPILKGLLTKD